MNKAIRILTITCFFTLAVSLNSATAQPHPSSQANGSNTGGSPIAGSGAPIGNGEAFLFIMAALYAGMKVYDARKLQLKQV
jgi:hypothetical protein